MVPASAPAGLGTGDCVPIRHDEDAGKVLAVHSADVGCHEQPTYAALNQVILEHRRIARIMGGVRKR